MRQEAECAVNHAGETEQLALMGGSSASGGASCVSAVNARLTLGNPSCPFVTQTSKDLASGPRCLAPCDLRVRYPELAADRTSGRVGDLLVSRHSRPPTVRRVLPNGMVRTLSRQHTTVLSQVPNQISPLHATTTPAGITWTAVLARRCK